MPRFELNDYLRNSLVPRFWLLSCPWPWAAPPIASGQPVGHVPGRLLVKPRNGLAEATVQSNFSNLGARQIGALDKLNIRVLQVPEARLARIQAALSKNRNFEFAEPDAILDAAVVPDDPWYTSEWHLPKVGAPQAWELTTGSAAVTIAVLDSGVESSHPDLAGRIVPGWNCYDDNADTTDFDGHGTSVAGQACVNGNNGLGVAAIAWGCKIMPIRVSDINGYALSSTLAKGLTYAADHGVRIANASFAIGALDQSLGAAADYFKSKGGIFTVAAGNNGSFDSTADDPRVIRVSATDKNDVLASWSCTGNNIDLCAPGVSILTTAKGGVYGAASGTSIAAPQVAATAALMLSVNPALSPSDVTALLKESADDLGRPAGTRSTERVA